MNARTATGARAARGGEREGAEHLGREVLGRDPVAVGGQPAYVGGRERARGIAASFGASSEQALVDS